MTQPTAADFTDLVDLAAERLGGAAVAANDEFFAPKENLLKAAAPEWREGLYTERGKWMDGWETRRRRTPGHDWCVVRLGLPGVVRGVVVDTSFFRGNYPEYCSVDGCALAGTPAAEELAGDATRWVELLARSPLRGDARNELALLYPLPASGGGVPTAGGSVAGPPPERCTHIRLNIYPDGGVARLRVYGDVVPEPAWIDGSRGEVDLAAMENGAFVVVCSDMFFGHRQNLILPGRSTHMGDGWETRRRRGPGHDWAVVRLATAGTIHRVELDTDHFKGNAPDAFTLDGCAAPGASADQLLERTRAWRELVARTKLQPHARHVIGRDPADADAVTHVRLNIFPDGGVARLRLYGRPG
jgi:allantoicase